MYNKYVFINRTYIILNNNLTKSEKFRLSCAKTIYCLAEVKQSEDEDEAKLKNSIWGLNE